MAKKSPIKKKTQVSIEGHTNPFMHEEMDFKAVGYAQIPGTNTWVSFVVDVEANGTVTVTASEPNLKAIAMEAAKIDFIQTLGADDYV